MSYSPRGCQESDMTEQAFTTFLPDFFLSFCFAVFVLMVRWMLLFDTVWWLTNPRVVFQRDKANTFPLTTDNCGHLPAPGQHQPPLWLLPCCQESGQGSLHLSSFPWVVTGLALR